MNPYCAVICLHNLGYQMKVLEGDQVAIRPSPNAEQAEMIREIRNDPQRACEAIQHLPQLCALNMPGNLKEYALKLFKGLKNEKQVQVLAVYYIRSTGATEWAFVPTDMAAHMAMLEITEYELEGVMYFECKEEGQRWGA